MINRSTYLEKLRRWQDKDFIKVVTGVRRCGKSTLLKLFADELKHNGVNDARIITLNLEQLEIDFVVEGNKGTTCFQVAENIPNDTVMERELAPLKRIKDNYPKYLLTLDDIDPIDHEGIIQINAFDWMLNNDR